MQAVKSFLALVWKIKRELKPELLVITMDSREKSFRHELDPQYKANRNAMPEALAAQFRPLYLALKFMAIPTWVMPGYEADDLLASLSRQLQKKDVHNYIITMDKDLTQLVNEHTLWVSATNFQVLNSEEVTNSFGVKPELVADLQALTGDSIDNVPGVPGIGKKNAADLINRYGSLDALIRNRSWIKGKLGEALRQNIERINLNRQLTTLRTDIVLPDLHVGAQEKEKFERLCQHYDLL